MALPVLLSTLLISVIYDSFLAALIFSDISEISQQRLKFRYWPDILNQTLPSYFLNPACPLNVFI
jgi:hypothetical protein